MCTGLSRSNKDGVCVSSVLPQKTYWALSNLVSCLTDEAVIQINFPSPFYHKIYLKNFLRHKNVDEPRRISLYVRERERYFLKKRIWRRDRDKNNIRKSKSVWCRSEFCQVLECVSFTARHNTKRSPVLSNLAGSVQYFRNFPCTATGIFRADFFTLQASPIF